MACFNIPGDAALSADGRRLLLTTGPDRTAQRVRVGIRTHRGSYKYDRSKGIPWQEALSLESPVAADVEVSKFLLSRPEIKAIRRLTFRPDKATRTLYCDFLVQTVGDEEVSGSLPIGVRQ